VLGDVLGAIRALDCSIEQRASIENDAFEIPSVTFSAG